MWWQYIIIVLGLAFLAYAVALIAGFQTRILTRKTDRRAEDLYPGYADTKPPHGHPAGTGSARDPGQPGQPPADRGR
ncbi:MAG TPA: hypothetical protein VGG35_28930 [Streptosporangiaceae bacterium]|jgi:hypothetical protein